MLPQSCLLMKSGRPDRHDDVQEVPGQEGHGGGEDEAAVAAAELGELGRLVQPVVDRIVPVGLLVCGHGGPVPSWTWAGRWRRGVTAITVAPGGARGAGVRAGTSPGGVGASVNGGFGATNGPDARAQPRSSATASGVCSRTMNRCTWAGTRERVASETPTMVPNASGTDHAAGWPSRTATQPRGVGAAEGVDHPDARPDEPDGQPGQGADVGEAAPPDAEHQQRAERGGGHRERQSHGPGDADVRGQQRHQRRAPSRPPRSPAGRRSPRAARPGRTRPGRSRRPPRSTGPTRWTGTPRTPRR